MAYFRFAGTEKESAIAKKLQKRRDFCFCNKRIARQGKAEYTFLPILRFHLVGANPLHPAMQQKTARRRCHSQKYGWASRIRTYITGTKNQGPAIGRWPSVCHKAFCDYNVSGMVKPNKQPIRQNVTTQSEYHRAKHKKKLKPIAPLAPKTPQRSQQQH